MKSSKFSNPHNSLSSHRKNFKSKAKYVSYAETHPKSFISALIVQGMLNDPSTDVKKAEKLYESLEESLKNTKPGKAIKARLTEMKAPTVGATPAAPAAPGSAK